MMRIMTVEQGVSSEAPMPIRDATRSSVRLDIATAQCIANAYVAKTFGEDYFVNKGTSTLSTWRFLIQYKTPQLENVIVVGRLDVGMQTGAVNLLSADDIQEIYERTSVLVADLDGVLPVDAVGNILPYVAKRNVNGYLAAHISLFASADGQPEWIAGEPPHWAVAIAWRQPNQKVIERIGSMRVNARTGEVVPLTQNQIKDIKRRAKHAVANSPCLTTATV